MRAIYRYAYDSYRDKDGGRLLPDPPTTILSTKRLWNGNTRRTTKIRNNDLGRWLEAINTVRQWAISGREDIILAVCDAVNVALFTGLRRSEVFGLEWSKINIDGRYFWIDETKNGDPLELPITDTLHDIFKRRLLYKRDNSTYVFSGARGGIITNVDRALTMVMDETTQSGTMPPIRFTCHDARRTFGSVAELAGVGSYILKRLLNHKTFRSADVTQGYLYFSADELMGPAQKVERAILEHAGFVEKSGGLDTQLLAAMGTMTDEEKRKILFDILNSQSKYKNT
ncbi:tyrosine-type recombinase/integrase [Salmonella enterica subsp. enterica]|nr:tyrosine-type recombinase/integrase [Salmonella enterica subsp. enterica serovar Agbeni]